MDTSSVKSKIRDPALNHVLHQIWVDVSREVRKKVQGSFVDGTRVLMPIQEQVRDQVRDRCRRQASSPRSGVAP